MTASHIATLAVAGGVNLACMIAARRHITLAVIALSILAGVSAAMLFLMLYLAVAVPVNASHAIIVGVVAAHVLVSSVGGIARRRQKGT